MAAPSKPRYPSDSVSYPKILVQLPTTRSPQRLHVIQTAKRIARFRRETLASFVVRAISREVLRCQAEIEKGPVSVRNEFYDYLEPEVIKLLSPEDRKKYGL